MRSSSSHNKAPKVIGISGASGMGKTTLTNALGQALHATKIFWDDYDALSKEPDDYMKWYATDRDYSAWDYGVLAKLLCSLKSGGSVICPATKQVLKPTEFIIFDAPLGYRHTQTAKYIDFLVFPNTPPDVALSRRLLRDFRNKESASINDVLNEIEFYLSARELHTMCYEENRDANLVVDGCLPVESQIAQILSAIEQFKLEKDGDE